MEDGLEEARRARRIAKLEKRDKQRAASYGRVAKMHAARTAAPMATPIAPLKGSFHVGCSGWFYWHWRGIFYTDDIPRTGWFRHYAENFDTVELNAPFYSWPTLATVKTWLRQAEGFEDFVYTVKVSELITHVHQFEGTEEMVRDFGYIADLLGARFGCFLFQLPPSYSFTREHLDSIVTQLDPTRRNVVEFRHRTWWNEDVYRAFREAGIIFCSCSAPRLPDELIRTAEDVYIRFHGKSQWYRHDYSEEELSVWVDGIRESGAARVWAYFNNDREGFAIRNAKALTARLAELAL